MSVLMPPLRNLALLTFTCGEVDTSIPLLRRLLELSEQILRPDYESKLHDGLNTVESPGLIPVLNTLGYAELLDGNTDNARTQYQRVLNISNVHSGSRSLETVQAVEHLAMVEYYAENFDEAGRLFQDAQQILLENGRSQSDEDVRRNIENAATATCRKGPRAFVASDK
ncbi:hypothetical protein CTAYLR_000837 [Chrysophaeum taylorii]|uniref:Tetratricopeptide repeat protein n=1 Tax=Chrysophaeum taylorii TaxID=2483200 RepID=A0AAD7UPF7_9STRA|nr:hypothetical protein CTAYLR_000837 [Chrysophaeum taylorii]